MSLLPLSELEAVNIILKWNGDTPVNDLTDTGNSNLNKAKAALTDVSRRLQGVGWSFNMDYDYYLAPTVSDEVELPANALWADPSGKNGSKDFVERGRKFWDRKDHTFTITEGVYVNIVWFLDFEDLPEHARQYFALSAASNFVAQEFADPEVMRLLRAELALAQAGFNRIETKTKSPNLKKTHFMADIVDPAGYNPRGRYRLNIS